MWHMCRPLTSMDSILRASMAYILHPRNLGSSLWKMGSVCKMEMLGMGSTLCKMFGMSSSISTWWAMGIYGRHGAL